MADNAAGCWDVGRFLGPLVAQTCYQEMWNECKLLYYIVSKFHAFKNGANRNKNQRYKLNWSRMLAQNWRDDFLCRAFFSAVHKRSITRGHIAAKRPYLHRDISVNALVKKLKKKELEKQISSTLDSQELLSLTPTKHFVIPLSAPFENVCQSSFFHLSLPLLPHALLRSFINISL